MMIRLVSYTEGGNQTVFESDFVSHHQSSTIASGSTVKVSSLRVEGVPRVLRLDSRNRLSLHVHGVRADPRPVFPPQVAQELRVPVAGNIPLIKPGCRTGCREGGSTLTMCFIFSFVNASFLKRFRQNNDDVELTFQCSGK